MEPFYRLVVEPIAGKRELILWESICILLGMNMDL